MSKKIPPRPAQAFKAPSYSYDGLLRLTEDELKAQFPYGASMVNDADSERWEPARKGRSGIGYRTLKELLHAKKVKPEKTVYLAANPGGSGQRWAKDENGKQIPDPNDDGKHDYTDRPDKAARGEWVVDGTTLDEFAKQNDNRFGVLKAEEIQRRKVRSLLGRLRTVAIAHTKAGTDPTPALEQAVADLERKQAS